jgi:hypothetical protein
MTFLNLSISAILTLFVYSYLLRDNALYRIASHLVVGLGVAYALTVAVHEVLLPKLLIPLQATAAGTLERQDLLIPFALGMLLLAKAVPAGARLGNSPLALLLGVGLGVSVGGALLGTLLPQLRATMLPLAPAGGVGFTQAILNIVVVLGTVLALLSFTYTRSRHAPTIEGTNIAAADHPTFVRRLGQWIIMIALGVILGGTILTYSNALVGRWDFLINDWLLRLPGIFS